MDEQERITTHWEEVEDLVQKNRDLIEALRHLQEKLGCPECLQHKAKPKEFTEDDFDIKEDQS